MEVIEFVNSKDIRDYWKEIDYEPSALESCWLIWQGKNQTLNKKHLAWKNLIDSSTDCSIPAGCLICLRSRCITFSDVILKLMKS